MMVKAIKIRSQCSLRGHDWAPAEGYTPEGLFLGECKRCGRKVWRKRPFTYESFQYDEAPVAVTVLRNTVLTIGAIILVLFWVYLLWPLFQ
jgi:hypothetical protein